MATNLPFCFFIQFLEQLLKFLVNFTLLKYVKSQRSYGFLITKELIFGFQILDLKDHFSASLTLLVQCGMTSFSLNFFSNQIQCSHAFLIIQFPESSNFIADETRDFPCIAVLTGSSKSAPPVF